MTKATSTLPGGALAGRSLSDDETGATFALALNAVQALARHDYAQSRRYRRDGPWLMEWLGAESWRKWHVRRIAFVYGAMRDHQRHYGRARADEDAFDKALNNE